VSSEIIDKLNQLLSEIFDAEAHALCDDTPFTECSSWDSLKHVELVVGIERRFAIDLSAAEIARLTCKLATREVLTARGAR
jgi:acyl carrier protein